MAGTAADGMYATFWDRFGIFCHDDRCQRNGLDKFPNELLENVKQYREALHGKTLVVRTWSSGAPHWLGDQYVHAPGYGSFGGTGEELWGRVFKEAPSDILIQTKVYNSDLRAWIRNLARWSARPNRISKLLNTKRLTGLVFSNLLQFC